MKRKSGLLWFVLLLSMSSCVTYEKFSIEVLKPAKFSVPPEIRKVAFVSRNLKFENDTLQNYQLKNHKLVKDKIRFNTDSLALKTCADTLAAKIMAQDRFDSILIVPVNTWPTTRIKNIRPAGPDWYQSISKNTGADGLILLDMFSCFYGRTDEYSNPVVNVITSNIWSFYDVRRQKLIDRFAQIDTLYWDGTDEAGRYGKLKIPAKKEAIMLAAGVIGENYSKYILPSWTLVYRDIMTCCNPELKRAAGLAKKSKWEEATAVWQKFAENNNRRNRIVALYNLALASEMSGDVDQAIKLTDQAARISTGSFWSLENEAIRKYSAVLYQRRTEIQKLSSCK